MNVGSIVDGKHAYYERMYSTYTPTSMDIILASNLTATTHLGLVSHTSISTIHTHLLTLNTTYMKGGETITKTRNDYLLRTVLKQAPFPREWSWEITTMDSSVFLDLYTADF